MPLISLRDVTKSYPPSQRGGDVVHAVEGLNLDIDAGDIYGIIGYSGAGKSTLVRLINALEHATSGSILVDGDEVTRMKEGELRRLGQTTGLEVHEVHVADRGEDGTLLLGALADATAELPADRIAGAILVTDGAIHDAGVLEGFPGPVQVLLTGHAGDWDRRVRVETAPAFAIVGEPSDIADEVKRRLGGVVDRVQIGADADPALIEAIRAI